MDAVARQRRVRAFRATDTYALEAYRVTLTFSAAQHGELVAALRRCAIRAGAALVRAAAHDHEAQAERRLLARARGAVLEGRYYLYAARRLGLLDLRRYRALTARQDSALKELDACLGSSPSADALVDLADVVARGS